MTRLTIEDAIIQKQREIKVITEQLEAARIYVEDKMRDLKSLEADLTLLNTVVAMLDEVPQGADNGMS